MNRTSVVTLRERSTPYDFRVEAICDSRSLQLYKGRSYNYALSAYWQAINVIRFLGAFAKIQIVLAKAKHPIGGFETTLESGRITTLHKPSGQCQEWTRRGWIEGDIAEKMISIIPGTLGLPR